MEAHEHDEVLGLTRLDVINGPPRLTLKTFDIDCDRIAFAPNHGDVDRFLVAKCEIRIDTKTMEYGEDVKLRSKVGVVRRQVASHV